IVLVVVILDRIEVVVATDKMVVVNFFGMPYCVPYGGKHGCDEEIEFCEDGINDCTCLNNTVADDDEVGGNEMTTAEVEQREAFIELKRKEVECREREIAATEYQAQQEDMKSNHVSLQSSIND
ncbi:hypothetical protein Tco_1270130, partial [Tanacetum coccineum]